MLWRHSFEVLEEKLHVLGKERCDVKPKSALIPLYLQWSMLMQAWDFRSFLMTIQRLLGYSTTTFSP